MVFASDDLVDALIGNAEHAGEFGLGFACVKAGDYNMVTFSNGKGGVRRQRKGMYPLQYAGNRKGDKL